MILVARPWLVEHQVSNPTAIDPLKSAQIRFIRIHSL
jgi:hypothetical protein